MKAVSEFFSDLITIVVGGIWYGFVAFMICAIVLLMIASFLLSIALIIYLLNGSPIPWYQIAAPFVLFFGIGVALFTWDD